VTASDTDFVALLGVKGGPAIYPGGHLPTSSLLRLDGRNIVIDCGAGVAIGLARQGVDLKQIDAIVITHLHSDHYLDLGPLIHTAWTAGLSRPLPVHGPRGLAEYWHHFLAAMRVDIETRIADEGRPDLEPLLRIHVLDAGNLVLFPEVRLTAIRNVHPPLVDSFALRFDGSRHSVVFSGDTAFHPPLADLARGADLLVHEALHPAGVDRLVARVGNGDDRLRRHLIASHTPAADAGHIAAMAGAKALALNHMVPVDDPLIKPADWEAEVRRTFAGRLHVGDDGMRIPLGGD
jgi:ribonuclease BN (tRNA processing enzyme)